MPKSSSNPPRRSQGLLPKGMPLALEDPLGKGFSEGVLWAFGKVLRTKKSPVGKNRKS